MKDIGSFSREGMVCCEASICADSLCRCIRMFYKGFFSQNNIIGIMKIYLQIFTGLVECYLKAIITHRKLGNVCTLVNQSQ